MLKVLYLSIKNKGLLDQCIVILKKVILGLLFHILNTIGQTPYGPVCTCELCTWHLYEQNKPLEYGPSKYEEQNCIIFINSIDSESEL